MLTQNGNSGALSPLFQAALIAVAASRPAVFNPPPSVSAGVGTSSCGNSCPPGTELEYPRNIRVGQLPGNTVNLKLTEFFYGAFARYHATPLREPRPQHPRALD